MRKNLFWMGGACAGLIVFLPCLAGAQGGGSLGLYQDAAGQSQSIDAPLFVTTTFYVVAHPDTQTTAGGMTGAEYRIAGTSNANALWTAAYELGVAIPEPSVFSDESLPEGQRGGVVFAFPACAVPDSNGAVLVSVIRVVPLTEIFDLQLHVLAKDPPTNPLFACPVLYACDDPVFTAYCANGVAASINGAVAVEETTFSAIKRLYR